jgi:hypothetical protein
LFSLDLMRVMKKRVVIFLLTCAAFHIVALALSLARVFLTSDTAAHCCEIISAIAFFAGFIPLFAVAVDVSIHRTRWDVRLPILILIGGYVSMWVIFTWWFVTKAD